VAIFGNLRVMDSAVYFDNQASSMAIEVCDKSINHLLPTEMQIIQFVPTHFLPKHHLHRRHFPPHPPRDLVLLRIVQPPYHPRFIHSFYLTPGPFRSSAWEGVTHCDIKAFPIMPQSQEGSLPFLAGRGWELGSFYSFLVLVAPMFIS